MASWLVFETVKRQHMWIYSMRTHRYPWYYAVSEHHTFRYSCPGSKPCPIIYHASRGKIYGSRHPYWQRHKLETSFSNSKDDSHTVTVPSSPSPHCRISSWPEKSGRHCCKWDLRASLGSLSISWGDKLTSGNDNPNKIHQKIVYPEIQPLGPTVRDAIHVMVIETCGIVQGISVQMSHAYNDS